MFAIIKSGGKQYKVAEKEKLKIEKIEDKEGSKIIFSDILLLVDKDKIKIGKPYIKEAKVEGKIIGQGKGDKIKIFKFKPKKRYKRTKGHRQKFTEIEIQKISAFAKATADQPRAENSKKEKNGSY